MSRIASINGVSIKELKRVYVGGEDLALQGTVCLNGQKLGIFRETGDGEPDVYEFDTTLLQDAVLLAGSAAENINRHYNLEMLISDILQLMDCEGYYKTFARNGKPIMSVAYLSCDPDRSRVDCKGFVDKASIDEQKIIKSFRKRKSGFKDSDIAVKIFCSPQNFIVSLGNKEDLPRLRAEAEASGNRAATLAEDKKRAGEFAKIAYLNKRFSFTPIKDATEYPKILIKDRATGKTTKIPKFSLGFVKRALADLAVGQNPQAEVDEVDEAGIADVESRVAKLASLPGFVCLAKDIEKHAYNVSTSLDFFRPAIGKDDAELTKWAKKYIAKKLWAELEDVPMDPDTECLDADWYIDGRKPVVFERGTHREEIWHWLEDTFNVSVSNDLMGMEDEPV